MDTFLKPSTESIDVSHHEAVAEPQPPRAAAGEVPKPIASTRQTGAPISEEEGKVLKSAAIAATVERPRAAPVVESGRLLVRSTPAGAGVLVDGQSRGVTPLDLRELAFGAHTIEVSHPNHETRQRRVTLSDTASGTIGRLRASSDGGAITHHSGKGRVAASGLASVRGTSLRRRQFDWHDAFAAVGCRSGSEEPETRVVGLQDLDEIDSDRAECTVSSVGKSGAVSEAQRI